ncbi:hypothetical protein [Burkholderia phage FLC9]|nr:hypothetical protein [Burkholderia phage FLC9]
MSETNQEQLELPEVEPAKAAHLRLVHSAPGLVNAAEPAGNASASVLAGTTNSGAAGIVSEDLLANEDRVACAQCGYLTFDCDNWIGGKGRVCGFCASEHFGGMAKFGEL